MPSPYTVGYCMPTAMYSIYATVGLHVTVPRMPVLQLYVSLNLTWNKYTKLCPLSVSVAFCESVCPIHFCPACRQSNTRRWPYAGLMLVHHLRRWASFSPVLGYRVVFGATLNLGQRHKRQANNINFCSAPAMLAQYLTDIGSVSVCTGR